MSQHQLHHYIAAHFHRKTHSIKEVHGFSQTHNEPPQSYPALSNEIFHYETPLSIPENQPDKPDLNADSPDISNGIPINDRSEVQYPLIQLIEDILAEQEGSVNSGHARVIINREPDKNIYLLRNCLRLSRQLQQLFDQNVKRMLKLTVSLNIFDFSIIRKILNCRPKCLKKILTHFKHYRRSVRHPSPPILPETHQVIEDFSKAYPNATQMELQQLIDEQTHIRVSQSTISRHLKSIRTNQ